MIERMKKEIEKQVLMKVLGDKNDFEAIPIQRNDVVDCLKEAIRLTEKIVDEKWHTRNRKMGEAYDEIIANKIGWDSKEVKPLIDEQKQKLLAEIMEKVEKTEPKGKSFQIAPMDNQENWAFLRGQKVLRDYILKFLEDLKDG